MWTLGGCVEGVTATHIRKRKRNLGKMPISSQRFEIAEVSCTYLKQMATLILAAPWSRINGKK